MPAAASTRSSELHDVDMEVKMDDSVHSIPLWLPSQFAQHAAGTQPIDHRLLEVEWKLWMAQACEALDQIRHHLQIRTHVFKFKDHFVCGQGANTRARDAIGTIQATIDNNRDTYRVARSALASLGHVLRYTNWESQFPVLMDSDIRGISDGEEGQSEGRKQLSWIWISMGVTGEDDGNLHLRDCASGLIIKHHASYSFSHPALHIEWCKSRARAMRFSEEVQLLLEEMCRVRQFLEWQESWWRAKAEQKNARSIIQNEGLRAYALRQATLRAGLRNLHSYVALCTSLC